MSEDLIKREDAIKVASKECHEFRGIFGRIEEGIKELPSADRPSVDKEYLMKLIQEAVYDGEACAKLLDLVDRPQEWIPCSERLPEDIRPVIVTWKNNDPESYYQYIVGKHFIGTAHYHRGKWYWYSSVTEDLLAEYGKCDSEEFDEAIEAVAWMPLPKPWKGADDE